MAELAKIAEDEGRHDASGLQARHHAVDLDTGAVVAMPSCIPADEGDTTTLGPTNVG